MHTDRSKAQAGFTLIEIIAVLVILGILTAVAVPKYMDLQREAAKKAVTGALAAMSSQVMMDYASAVLSVPSLVSTWQGSRALTVGDFAGSYTVTSAATGGTAAVSVTSGIGAASDWVGDVKAADRQRSFQVY